MHAAAFPGRILVAGLPYWLPATLALFWALRRPGRLPRVWKFANPYAFAGIVVVLFRILSIPAALALGAALGCGGAGAGPVGCTHAPDGFGIFLDRFSFIGIAVTTTVGLPSLAVCALAEIMTRRRRARS